MDNNQTQIIRGKFLIKLKGPIASFKEFSNNTTNNTFNEEDISSTRISVHQIAGAAKTFGFPEISDDADSTELCFDKIMESDYNQEDINNLKKALDKLIKVSEDLISKDLEKYQNHIAAEPSKITNYKYNIIVCDDDTLVIDFIKDALEKYDCYVIGIADGKDVINQAKKRKPNLIIQDVSMPEVNGFDILSKLKSNISTKNIPVMMLTKKADLSNVKKGIDYGADDYIAKPFDIDILIKRILKIVKH